MESVYLKTFVEVVRCGSFSKAAEALFVTQSAVSRRIKYMEDHYGMLLLDRTATGLQPTKAGLLVYDKACRLLAMENELDHELQKMSGVIPLSFACSRPFGISHLPAITNRFLQRYEGKVDIRLSFENAGVALQGLREGRHDIIVMEHWEKHDFQQFHLMRLGLDEFVLVSSPRLGLPSKVAVDRLTGYRLYRRSEECCSTKLLARNFASVGRSMEDFKNILIYDDLHVIISSVCAGEGIAFLSRSIVSGLIQSGTLREHSVDGFCLSRKRTLVFREEVPANQPFYYLVTCIANAFNIRGDIVKSS